MKQRVMIIGPKESGKSTVANWLDDRQRPFQKTQDALYGPYSIDSPAAYLENTYMYRYLMAISQTALVLVLMADGRDEQNVYSPGFVQSFTCPAVGFYLPADSQQQERAKEMLRIAGISEAALYEFTERNPALEKLKQQWQCAIDKEGK